MRSIDRKRQLFEHVLRLRRAERAAPSLRDVVAVRAALEELGETVSQRLAASLLGISHTGLRRWIESGDLAIVYNADGREQVPVSALLDLREAVDRERATGLRSRHLVEPAMVESRSRANAIVPATLATSDVDEHDAHQRAQRRSLAYHRVVAKRLRRTMVDDALHLIWAWREQGKIDPRYAERWERVLQEPVTEIRKVISEDTPAGHDLRQNSPFAGALSEAERRKLLTEIR